MKICFVFSVLVLFYASVICDESEEVADKMFWKPPYPENNYPSFPQSEPILPSIAMPSQGVLGVDKLYTPYNWPTPAVSPTGLTNMYILSNSTCSTNSAFRGCYFNSTIPYPFTCNGLQAYILPSYSVVALDGYLQSLVIPRLHQNNVYLNGNFIQLAAGVITNPPRCAGGILFEVVIYLANSQYQCVTSGVNGHKIIYQLKLITGNCQSTCWLWSGNTLLNPPINNLGAVAEPEPETIQEPEPEKPYPEKPYPEKPYPEKPYPEKPYPEKTTQKPYTIRPIPERPYPERPYQPVPEKPYQPYPEKPYHPQPQTYPEKPYQPYPQSYPELPYPQQEQSYPENQQYGHGQGQGYPNQQYQGTGNSEPNYQGYGYPQQGSSYQGKPQRMDKPYEGESFPEYLPQFSGVPSPNQMFPESPQSFPGQYREVPV